MAKIIKKKSVDNTAPKRVKRPVTIKNGRDPDTHVEVSHDPRFTAGDAPVPSNVKPPPGKVVIGVTNGVRYGVPGSYSSVNVDLTIHRVVEDEEQVIHDEMRVMSALVQREIEIQVEELLQFFED